MRSTGRKPLKTHQPLAELSTFGIGGAARYFVEVTSVEELKEALAFAKEEGFGVHILGKGSNSLFSDSGFDGLVIHNKISFCEIMGSRVSAGAGFSFSLLGAKTARKGLAGLEFASGIPASVGGAIFMNAGANGGEASDCLQEVTFVHLSGEVEVFPKEKLSFGYRTSPFQKMQGAIVSAVFELDFDESARERQLKIVAYRTKTQPYGDLSCGCVFQNPEGAGAGALIEKCGLKGKQVGGARVSELHGNFIVNAGGATAEDVLQLAEYVREVVKEKAGVNLLMELRKI
jgi:UDP-N-acetylmuramate dehydrogenase